MNERLSEEERVSLGEGVCASASDAQDHRRQRQRDLREREACEEGKIVLITRVTRGD